MLYNRFVKVLAGISKKKQLIIIYLIACLFTIRLKVVNRIYVRLSGHLFLDNKYIKSFIVKYQ